jgi:glucose/arabinose dehydrogenase
MKKILARIVLLLVLLVAVAVVAKWKDIKGALPGILPPDQDIAELIEKNVPGQNNTDFPLKLPENFKVEIFAKGLAGARVMQYGPDGALWVSQPSQGKISAFKDGKITTPVTGLNKPHGFVFDYQDPNVLYIAEEHQVTRRLVSGGAPVKIADLTTQSGGHSTRTIEFGPDGRLYVSIGSTCNVCIESDPVRASIYVMDKDGKNLRQYAKGLRNSVFFDWSEVDGSMWATEMGRDNLGDNTPPDEINVIREGGNYGWPNCYGNNIHDTSFDKNTYIRNPCDERFGEIPAKVELQAHSAPLGMDFVPEEGWPEEYWYDLIVAFHGSWNRTEPTGYKLVRVKLDNKGNYEGTEDFITGWLSADKKSVLGRPVDVLIQPGGNMYVSDDKAGVIYKVSKIRE